DVGVGRAEFVAHRRGEGRGGEGEQGGGAQGLAHGGSPRGRRPGPGVNSSPDHRIRVASWKDRQGERGITLAGSPTPRLTMMSERIEVPAKKAASTMALSKPVIGPASRPSERAARIR